MFGDGYYVLKSMRPSQWGKNLLLFASILFSQRIFEPAAFGVVFLGFIIFCALSGAVYILNDLRDVEADRRHKSKYERPIASGRLNKSRAFLAAAGTILLCLGVSYSLSMPFFVTALAYTILQAGYSLVLKNIIIVDVMSIAFGFILRVVAGAVVIGAGFSNWILICTSLLALFLALNKRRHELAISEGEQNTPSKTIGYSKYILDQMISVVTASTLISYVLYTMSAETIARFGNSNLFFTSPFVLYGIFRYLYLIHQRNIGGKLDDVYSDMPFILNIVCWVAAVALIIYP